MTKYTRNVKKVLEQLVVDNKQIYCKKECYIHIPARFLDKEMGEIGSINNSFGIIPIILKDSLDYAVLSVDAIVNLNPFITEKIVINDDEYYQLYFEANSVIIANTSVLRKDKLIYNILDEFLIKGKVPWYLDYEDLAKFLDTADSHAGSRAIENFEVIETLVSIISRDKNNRKVYMRNSAKNKDYIASAIEYIPLSSVMYAVSGTVNKLIGAYMDEGIASALTIESTEASNIEKLLRA